MRNIAILLAALMWGLAVSQSRAQGSLRGTSRSSGKSAPAAAPAKEEAVVEDAAPAEEEEEEAPKPKPSRKKRPADAKGMVEEALRERLTVAQKNWHDQKAFGSKMSERWEKFFSELYEDRKRFETSIARQRLNLFETMSSVGPGYRDQAVGDFERMQGTMLKSFEGSQKQKMDEFFGKMMEDVKLYAGEQDKRRAELVTASMDAWKDQKVMVDSPAEKKEKRKKGKD